jgi:hypothetical protein
VIIGMNVILWILCWMNGGTLAFDDSLSPFLSRGKLGSLHRFLNVFRVFVVKVYSFFMLDVRHSSSNYV